MTFNPEELFVELNMSNDVDYLDTIMKYQPNKNKLIGCHNFYPHGYSGLGLEFLTAVPSVLQSTESIRRRL